MAAPRSAQRSDLGRPFAQMPQPVRLWCGCLDYTVSYCTKFCDSHLRLAQACVSCLMDYTVPLLSPDTSACSLVWRKGLCWSLGWVWVHDTGALTQREMGLQGCCAGWSRAAVSQAAPEPRASPSWHLGGTVALPQLGLDLAPACEGESPCLGRAVFTTPV